MYINSEIKVRMQIEHLNLSFEVHVAAGFITSIKTGCLCQLCKHSITF